MFATSQLTHQLCRTTEANEGQFGIHTPTEALGGLAELSLLEEGLGLVVQGACLLDILGVGEMGIGNTTAASAITAAVTAAPVEDVTGRGTGLDDKGLKHKAEVVSKVLQLNLPRGDDGLDLLCKVGGFEIGGMAGAMLAAAAHGRPVLIDGFISGAAALIANLLAPRLSNYLFAAHLSVEIGHRLILQHLGLTPLLDLQMRLGEGTGAALGISLVEAAVLILGEMATFDQAGISGAEE